MACTVTAAEGPHFCEDLDDAEGQQFFVVLEIHTDFVEVVSFVIHMFESPRLGS